MKILVTGANGQLANAISKNAPININNKKYELILADRKFFDLIDFITIERTIKKIKSNWIINTAAYTNVERAEEEPELANLTNSRSLKFISEIIKGKAINLLNISTDFVFNGKILNHIKYLTRKIPAIFTAYQSYWGKKEL